HQREQRGQQQAVDRPPPSGKARAFKTRDHRDPLGSGRGSDQWCLRLVDRGLTAATRRVVPIPQAEGIRPRSARTSSRNLSPRTSKLRYWSKEAQAGDSRTTGSATSDASASAAASSTARSSVPATVWGTRPSSSAAKSVAASPIR